MLRSILVTITFALYTTFDVAAQDASVFVSPDGLKFANGQIFIVVETGDSKDEIISNIVANVKTKSNSKYITVEVLNDAIVIKDFIPGYTKTDKSAGSAYQLDLSYKMLVEVKDGRYKINVPELDIAANQKYDGFAVVANSGVQFTLTMGFSGKRDVWNNKEKKLFIFDEKGKLVEKSTKDKLEKDLSRVVDLVADQTKKSDW
ncbi:hypothetical protein [Sphingobacterium corticibacter]|nr:hypothetical protein [Sphingobacterium corticibacter]